LDSHSFLKVNGKNLRGDLKNQKEARSFWTLFDTDTLSGGGFSSARQNGGRKQAIEYRRS